MSRRRRARKRGGGRLWHVVGVLALAAIAATGYGGYLAWTVTAQFEGRRWDVPAQVYAAPLELYAGRRLAQEDLVTELRRLGYREDPRLERPGTYRVAIDRVAFAARPLEYAGEFAPERLLAVTFDGGTIRDVRDARGDPVPLARLDPALIGNLFPAHGEDRLIVAPHQIPPLLTAALKIVEDRRFDTHLGIDLVAVLRAAWVNLTAGEIRQGASTLTQQLVRSYFLSNERTWDRKVREAFMAVALELRYSKDELLHAYVNEIYLGQDGGRAIHGFGLASRFYFGKPLGELELPELALLVAQVRGPTYYDPRRHPERALERRNLVIGMLAEAGLVSPEEAERAAAAELGVVLGDRARPGATYAAFLDLVRRQLGEQYDARDLEASGLKVYSTLDPIVQNAAERALAEGLDALGPSAAPLQGAVVVASPYNGEVQAIVGGRDSRVVGFNRALDARRQIGSLVKPAVYLAALESGRFTLASLVDDAPIDLELDNGARWMPTNFDERAHGYVPLVRALAESMNLATVRLGLEVGLDAVASTLERLGLSKKPPLYPSLLLGSLDLTPLEVAQVYSTLATGGLRMPLTAVRAVVDDQGRVLERRTLAMEPAVDAEAAYAVNQALVVAMERGTGRTARAELPPGLTAAGKTGTSDAFRDSWFAGFTDDRLVVTWIGADDNRPTGFSGATGAGRIWSRIVKETASDPFAPQPPATVESHWIDYQTGTATREHCPGAVLLPLAFDPPGGRLFGCDGGGGRLFGRFERLDRERADGAFDDARRPAAAPASREPRRGPLRDRLRRWLGRD